MRTNTSNEKKDFNMHRINLLILLFAVRFSRQDPATIRAPFIEGYYWRDFAGVVPSDALPGGSDHNGRLIYIGQTLSAPNIIPGKIYGWEDKIRFAWVTEQITTQNIKILCTQNPEKFEWVKTRPSAMRLLTNRHFVVGGFQPGVSSYIGRIFHKTETVVGKVILTNDQRDELGLYIGFEGKEIFFKDYEVLIYNP